jgi:hypothetical protein
MMDVAWTLGALALAVVLLAVFVKLRPRFVAARVGRRTESRNVNAGTGTTPGSWQAIFAVTTSGLSGRQADLAKALARDGTWTDVLRGLIASELTAVLARRESTETPFTGTLDDALRDDAARALERVGLRLERLELFFAVRLDARLARLARYLICDTQRDGRQGEGEALELYLDGISGLGEWWTEDYESGTNRFMRAVDLVQRPGATLQVMRKPSRSAVFRTLTSLLDED